MQKIFKYYKNRAHDNHHLKENSHIKQYCSTNDLLSDMTYEQVSNCNLNLYKSAMYILENLKK